MMENFALDRPRMTQERASSVSEILQDRLFWADLTDENGYKDEATRLAALSLLA